MKQKLNTISALLIIGLSVFASLSSCKDDNPTKPEDPNEEELITTVELTFTDSTNLSNVSVFRFKDADGDGGNDPSVFDTINLENGKTYLLAIRFLDESNSNNVLDITEEIEEESAEHIVCFTPSALNGLKITRTDSDGTFEIGLQSKWITTEAGLGAVKIALKHQPGNKNGTCAPGHADVEINFPTVIK